MKAVLDAASTLILLTSTALPAQGFVNFETGQVHPIAVSAAGDRLFVTNTPDNRLAIYSLANPRVPRLMREVFVGLEPVADRPRTADEVWVVNFLSDHAPDPVLSSPNGQPVAVRCSGAVSRCRPTRTELA